MVGSPEGCPAPGCTRRERNLEGADPQQQSGCPAFTSAESHVLSMAYCVLRHAQVTRRPSSTPDILRW